jgi:predicted RNase H-like HicB family nuclease
MSETIESCSSETRILGSLVLDECPTNTPIDRTYEENKPLKWSTWDAGKTYQVFALVGADEDGILWSRTPSLPGAVSQGDTVEEAVENLKEAVAGCIESYRAHNEPIPWERDVAITPLICASVNFARLINVHV